MTKNPKKMQNAKWLPTRTRRLKYNFFYNKIFLHFQQFFNTIIFAFFLIQNFCIFYTKIFAFLHRNFCIFLLQIFFHFLHQICCIFTPKFLHFFAPKFFSCFTPEFLHFFTPTIWLFYNNFFSTRKILFFLHHYFLEFRIS